MGFSFVKVYDVVGIKGDAALYCLACARLMYGVMPIAQVLSSDVQVNDREDNPLWPVFAGDVTVTDVCDRCFECFS